MRSPDVDMTEHGGEVASARRRAGIVAAVAGLGIAPYFWLSTVLVGWPADKAPSASAPASEYVDFYVEEFSRIPGTATLAIGSWAIWLVLVVAVVRAACRRLDLAAVLAVTLAGASTAVYVAAEGVLAWPTIGMTASEIPDNLDAGVAQAMVLSRDGLHAAASVLLGLSLLVVSSQRPLGPLAACGDRVPRRGVGLRQHDRGPGGTRTRGDPPVGRRRRRRRPRRPAARDTACRQ